MERLMCNRLHNGKRVPDSMIELNNQPLLRSGESFEVRNVAIDFKYGIIIKQLHSAVYDDFTSVLAGVAQLARPVTAIQELQAHLRKLKWKFRWQLSEWLTWPIAWAGVKP
jgi:hypothetical protein